MDQDEFNKMMLGQPQSEPIQPPEVPPSTEEFLVEAVNEDLDPLVEIGIILANHGGLESNIPINHKYWDLTAQVRSRGK